MASNSLSFFFFFLNMGEGRGSDTTGYQQTTTQAVVANHYYRIDSQLCPHHVGYGCIHDTPTHTRVHLALASLGYHSVHSTHSVSMTHQVHVCL